MGADAARDGGGSRALAVVLVVVLLAGALFGYDQGVISGALTGIQREFQLSPLLVEVVTSWVTLGAMAGSLAGGELADRLGRRRALLVAGALFAGGAAIEAFAPNVAILVAGRLTVGFGVGVAAVAAPLYAAELAPAAQRGRFVSCYQLAITIGIFLSYLIDAAFAEAGAWRMMLGVSAVPALLLLVAMIPAVESPRWLVRAGRRDDARAAIVRVRPGVDPDVRLQAIEAALAAEATNASWREVFAPAWRRPLAVGLGLAVFQQITGINAIIYYSDRIFEAAGFSTPLAQAQATTWAIGGVNVLATLIAIAFIDRLGRRPLLLAGLAGMGVSLAVVGAAFFAMGKARRRDRTERGGHRDAGGARRVHRVVRVLARPGRVDGDQRDLSRPRARPRGRRRHRRQLGRRVRRQRVLPDAGRRDRRGGDVLAVRVLLRRGRCLGLAARAGDQGTLARADRGAVAAGRYAAHRRRAGGGRGKIGIPRTNSLENSMALVSMRQLLDHAAEHGYGLPAFNVNNLEQVQAIMQAAAETDSPVIMQASAGARKYAGEIFLRHLIEAAVETYPHIPVVMHQDHGQSPAVCDSAMKLGFSSVMMDGSLREDGKSVADYDYNVDVTRTVVDRAHAIGVTVEGELGCLGSLETMMGDKEDGHGADGAMTREMLLTDPDQAADFVKRTQLDALAIAIGTSHGAYKFSRKPTGDILAIDRIKAIHARIPNTHLVMHGSSSVPQNLLAEIRKYGGDMKETYGVPVEEIQEGIRHGVRKVNIDTDIRLAMTAAVRKFLAENPSKFDPREFLKPALLAAKAICVERYQQFGCAGMASKIKPVPMQSIAKKYQSGELRQVVN